MKIDVTEQFELLPRAPIVEAVIQIHARPEISWDEKEVLASLRPKLSEFENSVSRKNVQHQVTLGSAHQPMVSETDLGWHGLVCRSKDQSVQFNRDGFVFSRLQPYQSWNQFYGDAMRLWEIYQETAHPVEMQRIGLRYINKIQLPPKETDFERYIQPHPVPPDKLELPFLSFFHQDTLAVPGYPYAINIIRTVMPAPNSQAGGVALIVDIDAFTTQPLDIKEGVLGERLTDLRWLKNKAFFGSITPVALELFR